MATPSEVKSGLDSISDRIKGARQSRQLAKDRLLAAHTQLSAIPAEFADVISTIDGYAPTGAFESLSKDERTKLTTDFADLIGDLETELTALGVSFS